jgi:hypothetical protein
MLSYKGSLECDQLPPGKGTLRTALTITVRDGNVIAVVSIFDVDGLHEDPLAMAAGSVDAAGVLHLGHTIFRSNAEFRGNYTGTLSAAGGTLTGPRSGPGHPEAMSRAPAPAMSSKLNNRCVCAFR